MNSQNRVVAQNVERVDPIIPILNREVINAILVGLGTGLAINLLYFLLEKFVFGAVMCRDMSVSDCSEAPQYAMIVAMIIGGLAGLIALVQIRVYRPLLVVLAMVASLWSFNALLVGLGTLLGIVLMTLLFAATMMLFVWVARVRSFAMAVALSIILVVLIRFVIVGT